MIEFSIQYTKDKRNSLNNIQNEILDEFKEIKKLYSSLNEDVWKSSEKEVLDEVFLDYININERNLNDIFNHDMALINNMIKVYEEADMSIKKSVGDGNG